MKSGPMELRAVTRALLVFPLVILVVVIDQFSKYWAVASLAEGSRSVIPGVFSLSLAYNKGAAFGLFAGVEHDLTRYLALGGATLFALGVVTVLFRDYKNNKMALASLALVLGGAIGNIIDRISFGVVIDFLDVYWKEYHWPTFNIADSAICVGVGVLIFISTFHQKKRE